MTRLPGIHLCPSGIMWLWEGDAIAVYRWEGTISSWVGTVSSLPAATQLSGNWKWCAGNPVTAQPQDPECLIKLNQIAWKGFPDWFFNMYAGV